MARTLNEMNIKALPIHSDNKREPFHIEYAGKEGEDGKWGDDVQVYITTRATVDGFSVQIGEKQGVKVAEIFDATLQYGSQMINQRSHRVRDYKADVFVGMSDDALKHLGKGGHFDFQYYLKQDTLIANQMLESAKAINLAPLATLENEKQTPTEKVNNIANKVIMKMYKGWVKFDDNGELAIDEIAIIQRVTNAWLSITHDTPDIMINELEAYNFKYQDLLDMTGKADEAEVREQTIKTSKKEIKEKELNQVQSFAKEMDLLRARAVCKNATSIVRNESGQKKEEAKAKVKAAKLIVRLTDKGLSEGEAQKQIAGLSSLRKDAIKRIEERTELTKIRETPNELIDKTDPKVKFLARIQNGKTFRFGETLTVAEITQRVKTAAEACGIPEIMVPLNRKERRKKNKEKRYDSDREVMKLIKDIYIVSRGSKVINNKKLTAYKFKEFVSLILKNDAPIN